MGEGEEPTETEEPELEGGVSCEGPVPGCSHFSSASPASLGPLRHPRSPTPHPRGLPATRSLL